MKTTEKQVLFWGDKDIYSNFYKGKGSHFSFEGKSFVCSEQAFMWSKAMTFGDSTIAESILKETIPLKAKGLGRAVKNYDDAIWSNLRYKVMVDVLKAKFSVDFLKEQLLATGDKRLVEASPYDKIWGIKLGENDPRAYDESQWKGQNLLGNALEEVREFYRK